MSEEVMLVVKIPIQHLADDIRKRYRLAEQLFDVRLEAENLIFSFKTSPTFNIEPDKEKASVIQHLAGPILEKILPERAGLRDSGSKATRKRRRSQRNRMKTRGWQVVGKILNSKGQTAIIYRPFVQALFKKELTPAQQRAAVCEILRSNGNDPTESSTDYFVFNTLEYLAQVNK